MIWSVYTKCAQNVLGVKTYAEILLRSFTQLLDDHRHESIFRLGKPDRRSLRIGLLHPHKTRTQSNDNNRRDEKSIYSNHCKDSILNQFIWKWLQGWDEVCRKRVRTSCICIRVLPKSNLRWVIWLPHNTFRYHAPQNSESNWILLGSEPDRLSTDHKCSYRTTWYTMQTPHIY